MLVFFDGFENHANMNDFQRNWSYTNILPQISTTGGFKDSQAIYMDANSRPDSPDKWNINYSFSPISTSSVGIAIKFQPDKGDSNNINPIIEIRNDNDINICVYLKYVIGGGYMPFFTKIYNTNPIYHIATGDLIKGNFKLSDWHYYELELDCNVDGFAKFYIDGNLVLELNDYNFTANAVPYSNLFRTYAGIYYENSLVRTITTFDNFYLNDQPERIGQLNIRRLGPIADTAQKDWSPSAGSDNYSIVNKIGTSSATYVSTMTEDGTDLYEIDNLFEPAKIANIVGIKASTLIDKSAFGDTNVNLLINDIILPTIDPIENVIIESNTVMENNPATNLNWSISDIDTLQIGITSHINSDIFCRSVSGNLLNGAIGSLLTLGDTPPSFVGNDMIFAGSEVIRYTNAPQYHITAPYSIEFDFYVTQIDDMIVVDIGGNDTDYASLSFYIDQINNNFNMVTHSQNDDLSASITTMIPDSVLEVGRWYRIGLMVYDDGGLRIRGYVDGVEIFDNILDQPWDSTAGLSIGNRNDNDPALAFYGGIRNLRIAQSLFWKI